MLINFQITKETNALIVGPFILKSSKNMIINIIETWNFIQGLKKTKKKIILIFILL